MGGRGPPVRGPLGPPGRLDGPPGRAPGAPGAPAPAGRRIPGGGGIGRPLALVGGIGRGGGGIGRPLALVGGMGRDGASPASPAGRWLGRMVWGPPGAGARGATGFGGTTVRVRTVRGSDEPSTTGVASAGAAGAASATGAGVGATGAGAGAGVSTGAGAGAGAATSTAASSAALALALARLFDGSSGCTSRRRPSVSARRRIRSAWASSMDAEELEA
jgi:hypothetical protein